MKKQLSQNNKELYLKTFLVAFIATLAAFAPFILLNKGYFIYMGDYNSQQIPFYTLAHDAVLSGNIGWDWNTDMGANFIGSYTYYMLGSPFFWLTLIFPTSWVPYLLGPILALKIGIAATTAYAYIRRYVQSPNAACIGGLLYALSGWSIFNIFFNQFHEALVIFPLFLLAMDMHMEDKKKGVFALAVFASAFINYYFFFGMAIFAILYWAVKILTKTWKFTIKTFAVLFFEAILGTLMAAVFLIPSALAVLSMPRLSSTFSTLGAVVYTSWKTYAHILYSALFIPEAPAIPVCFEEANTMWSSTSLWLPVFGSVGAIAWMTKNKKSWQTIVVLVCVGITLIPILNAMFNLFNPSTYMRWYYMPILLLSMMTAKAFDTPTNASLPVEKISFKKPYLIIGSLMTVFALIFGFCPNQLASGEWVTGLYKHDDTKINYASKFWIFIGVSFLSMLLLAVLIYYFRKNRATFYRYSVCFVVMISFATMTITIAMGKSHTVDANEYYVDRLLNGSVTLDVTDRNRIHIVSRDCNNGMYLGYHTATSFHSIVPASISNLYDFLGDEYIVSRYISPHQTALLSLLGSKYVLCDKTDEGITLNTKDNTANDSETARKEYGNVMHPGFKQLADQDGYEVYENQYCIPIGVTYNTYISYEDACKLDEKKRDDLMLKAVILKKEDIAVYQNVLAKFKKADNPTSMDYSTDAYFNDASALASTAVNSFAITKTGFTATTSLKQDGLVFMSIPDDPGWSATVDGKEVDILNANVGFMAIPVSSGTHTVVFTYETPGLRSGAIISISAFAICLLYLLLAYREKKLQQS